MRYRDEDNLHKDFHISTYTTLQYIQREYGENFLKEVLYRTAQKVYLEIYLALQKGQYEPLLEHLLYYYDRENGEFKIERSLRQVTFSVTCCPAFSYTAEALGTLEPVFFAQMKYLAEGWSQDTPFTVGFQIHNLREGRYSYTITRKDH